MENTNEQEICDKWYKVLAYVVTRAPEETKESVEDCSA